MKCPLCDKGTLKPIKIKEEMFGVYLGEFPAKVCSECGLHIKNFLDVTVDHIQPRSKYPELALDIENLCVLCRRCNSQKGDRDSEIYANEQA